MAEEKKTFPMLSTGSWWTLRDKLNSTPRIKVSPSFLASLLGMNERSVKINALNYFKQVGLLDEEGLPTDLAMKWRDDETYAAACEQIRDTCYPQELVDLFPSADADVAAVKRWFMNNARVGEASATKQARFYLLLTKADVAKPTEAARKSVNTSASNPRPKPKSKGENKSVVDKATAGETFNPPPPALPVLADVQPSFSPALHIDIQIHITPDTPPEQIDRIFESMAKHFPTVKGNKAE